MFNRLKSSASVLILVVAGLTLAGCDTPSVRTNPGFGVPLGYGHSHGHHITTPHGHHASYDTALGMYVLMGLSNIFWHNGHYYRFSGGNWYRSRNYRRWRRHQGPGRWKNRYPNRVRIQRH